jgi:hypothetical protein
MTYRNDATDGVAVDATGWRWFAVHTASPAGGVANEVVGGTYARQQITFPVGASGQSQVTATFNIPAGTTVTHWSRQAAATGGTNNYEDGTLLLNGQPSSAVFNSAGTLTLTLTVSTPA